MYSGSFCLRRSKVRVLVPAPSSIREPAADPRPVLVHSALPRFAVEELTARREDVVLLVPQHPLPLDLLRVLLADIGDRLAEALGEPPDISVGDRRSGIRAAVGRTFGAVVAGRGRVPEYSTPDAGRLPLGSSYPAPSSCLA